MESELTRFGLSPHSAGVIGLYTYTFVSLLSHWPQATLFTNESQLGEGPAAFFMQTCEFLCNLGTDNTSVKPNPQRESSIRFVVCLGFAPIVETFSPLSADYFLCYTAF